MSKYDFELTLKSSCTPSTCPGNDHYDLTILTGLRGWPAGLQISWIPNTAVDPLAALNYTSLGGVYTAELGAQYGQVSQYDRRGRMTTRYSVNLAGNVVLSDGWGYDSWGNQTSRTLSEGTGYQWNYMPTIRNQASGLTYDAAGNTVSDGLHSYSYDAENRVAAVADQGVTYRYDPEGQRVATVSGGAASAEYLYDMSGSLVTTVNGTGQMVRGILRDNGGLHWGDYVGAAGTGGVRTEFRLVNQVGTLVANGDSQGNFIEGCLSGPFGDGQLCTPGYDFTETHFTDRLRDAETDNDDFGARYFNSTLGRFLSPDPSGLYYADPLNPQSLNLYSYAQNNPLTNTDPTGLDCVYFNDAGSGIESVDHNSGSGECGSNGGDYVKGRIESAQAFGNGGDTTFGFRSGDSSNSYTTYATAPGSQSDGTSCFGNCDLPNGYFQSSNLSASNDVPLNSFALGVIQGVAARTASLPDVCGVGITARVGLPGSRLSAGMDASSQNGTRRAGGARIARLGNVQGSVSVKGESVSASITVPIPGTPFVGGVSTKGSGVSSLSVGIPVSKFGSIQDYVDVGTLGSCTR